MRGHAGGFVRAWRALGWALLAVCAMAANGWHRPFWVLGPDQGLPMGGITSLTQDTEGFIWVGTENGLLRYEGGASSRWTRADGLPSDTAHRVLADPAGGIWVATPHGLAHIQDGRIAVAKLDEAPPGLAPTTMALDEASRLWVATTEGLFVQQRGLQFKALAWATQGRQFSLARGRRGAMHLGSDRGVWTFLPGGSIQSWGPAEGLPAGGVTTLVEDGQGNLWAGTGRQLVMKSSDGLRFTDQSQRLKGSLSPNSVPFLDVDGSVWIPTQAGALHLEDGKAELLDTNMGLPFRWVRTVFRDREGTLWVLGTNLARLQGSGRIWNHALSGGDSGEVVWAMLRDPQGRLLVGTDDGAVRQEGGRFRRIPGTEGRRIKYQKVDRTGLLWMVSTVGPTLWLRPGATRAEVAPLGDLGFGINTVIEDSRGTVWLGHTRQGLLRWDPRSSRLVQEVGPGSAPGAVLGVFQIKEDPQGRLWAATGGGLYLRDERRVWRQFNASQGLKPYGLFGLDFLPDGSAWIFYQEPLGLTRVRVEGDQLTVVEQRTKGQGLRSSMVYAVAVDNLGHTWATTEQGVDRLDPVLHLGRREGMVTEDCDLLGLLAEPGRLWVGTAGGLVRYDTDQVTAQGAPPRVHILRVIHGERQTEAPMEELATVSAKEASLAFRVAVPSYKDEGLLRIQVRLVGLEESWHDVDAPLVRYPALPGGNYRFEARAMSPEGGLGAVTSLRFQVRPPWWRSWWMLGLEALAVLGTLGLLLRVRLAALARAKVELEALVARRTDELSTRNEELSGALGRVRQLSGLLPICSCCKKIRDDRGYWNQLEQYFSEHSDVGFSHGICPECVGTMFPGRGRKPGDTSIQETPPSGNST